jgi:hypothetical protein
MKRIAWILGWAVPEAWFAAIARAEAPRWDHVFFEAAPDAVARATKDRTFDSIGGYSLGAHLLLAEGSVVPAVLLAPIFAFPREAGAGGRLPRAQVKALSRWLHREPQAAIADFYHRVGLGAMPPMEIAAATLDRLQWGLTQLENNGVPPVLPPGWSAWCGADDPLLDAEKLHTLVPAVRVVGGVGHHPAALLRAWTADSEL